MNQTLIKLKSASQKCRILSKVEKDSVLLSLATLLNKNRSAILKANEEDLALLDPSKNAAFRDRLVLNDKRIDGMIESVMAISAMPDPVGEITETSTLKNGLQCRKVRAPLGVILVIFESRPNVAIDSFALSFKAGNAVMLRGGKESANTCREIYQLIHEALMKSGFPEAVHGITDPDRKVLEELLKQKKYIDVVIPRGGDSLIDFVVEHSKIPIIKNDKGMCHVYIHEDADLKMATEIVKNAKTQRPGVCNAIETLLVHAKVASEFLPFVYNTITKDVEVHPPVDWYCCNYSHKILGPLGRDVHAADQSSFDTEYLDYKLNCKVVTDINEAISHIELHGSKHSEAIVTASKKSAEKFQHSVDAAVVYWNASTRFTDGFELGLGGEIGISTQKLHVRGPVGLRELTSVRWIIEGSGQIRE